MQNILKIHHQSAAYTIYSSCSACSWAGTYRYQYLAWWSTLWRRYRGHSWLWSLIYFQLDTNPKPQGSPQVSHCTS